MEFTILDIYIIIFFFPIWVYVKEKPSWNEILFTYVEDFYKNFVFRCIDSASLSVG